jgi:hypothetical protein
LHSGDFMEAVFRWTDSVTGFIRFRPELTGTCQIRQPDIHGILLQESSAWACVKKCISTRFSGITRRNAFPCQTRKRKSDSSEIRTHDPYREIVVYKSNALLSRLISLLSSCFKMVYYSYRLSFFPNFFYTLRVNMRLVAVCLKMH